MNDIDGPFMAEAIYKRVFRNGGLDLTVLPYALDDAARELRELGAPASRWATYVHFGVQCESFAMNIKCQFASVLVLIHIVSYESSGSRSVPGMCIYVIALVGLNPCRRC